jgi:4-diphosphocytidyl-2-C-methyl-D-erythritol kinase
MGERLLIRLDKHVPPAGGLGGGASDAATVLRLLGQHWDAPEAVLFEVANTVGSDEAALLLGGTVRARGRGDKVSALAELPDHDVVLFVPPETIEKKTARMFGALAGLPFDDGSVTEEIAVASAIACTDIYNTFERVTFDLFPSLAEQWEALEEATGEAIRLAGAGPTLFWIGPLGMGQAVAERAAGSACKIIPTSTARSLWRQ